MSTQIRDVNAIAEMRAQDFKLDCHPIEPCPFSVGDSVQIIHSRNRRADRKAITGEVREIESATRVLVWWPDVNLTESRRSPRLSHRAILKAIARQAGVITSERKTL